MPRKNEIGGRDGGGQKCLERGVASLQAKILYIPDTAKNNNMDGFDLSIRLLQIHMEKKGSGRHLRALKRLSANGRGTVSFMYHVEFDCVFVLFCDR